MKGPDREAELVNVVLLGFPLDVYQRAQEHADGLIREFALIAQDRQGDNAVSLPARLIAIIDTLTTRYGAIGSGPESARDAAIDRGERVMDLHYRVPPSVAEASRLLGAVFDEADEYCLAGEHLLTLASPPEALAFRRWFIDEFIRQIAGASATPWRGDPER